jgi:hypothetical protein
MLTQPLFNSTAPLTIIALVLQNLSEESTIEQKGLGLFKYKKGVMPIKIEK